MHIDFINEINKILDIIYTNQVDIDKLMYDIVQIYDTISIDVRESITKDLDKVISIINMYIQSKNKHITEEDKNKINALMSNITRQIILHANQTLCQEDIDNLFEQKEEDLIKIPSIPVLKIVEKGYLYDKNTKLCNIEFKKVKLNSFKMYANNDNKYIMNNIFTVHKESYDAIFNTNFIEAQFDYINNLSERDKVLLYTYTNKIGVKIIQNYKRRETDYVIDVFKEFQIDDSTSQIPLFYILIDYLENKFDLDYNDLDDLNASILDIIENDELFTQDDIINVIELYIYKINEIINNAPSISNVILYRGITKEEYFDSNKNIFFNSFSMIPYVSWIFVNDDSENELCCMIRSKIIEEIPVLFIAMIASENSQYEILLSNNVKYTNIRKKIENCTFRSKEYYYKLYGCIVFNMDCVHPINRIKDIYSNDLKHRLCNSTCQISVIENDVTN
jgi:hypothetical protein